MSSTTGIAWCENVSNCWPNSPILCYALYNMDRTCTCLNYINPLAQSTEIFCHARELSYIFLIDNSSIYF